MALPSISKEALSQVIEASHPVVNLAATKTFSNEEGEPHITNLLMTMQSSEFVSPFDWQSEFEKDPDSLQDIELVKKADLEQLRKLMTANIRIDRMSDGHLDSLIKSGYWSECLSRLKAIYNEME